MAQLKGTDAADLIRGTNLDDSIRGLAGDDVLLGRNGDDRLDGRKGDDLLVGAMGADVLNGGAGDDVLRGGTRSQEVFPFEATDTLDGGAGRDRLIGGYGDDLMTGGTGADKFIYNALDDSDFSQPDQITDFAQGQDTLLFRRDFATADLHFIGQNQFSGTPGEVQFVFGGGESQVRIDLDGDGVGDFRIVFTGEIHLQASDFSF